ncbi:MAG: DUF1501 domain-containing protein [Acidobacteriota bacterium]
MKRRNPSNDSPCPGCLATPLTRRELLKTASSGFGMLSLSALLADPAYAGLSAKAEPNLPAKARNVIFCYMQGAVSHVDTFDPKPKLAEWDGRTAEVEKTVANKDPRKWLKSPWKFQQYGQSGIPVSELFPHLATCVDDLAIIRSMVSGFPLHPRANIFMHTGRNVGGYPSLGSWVNYALGSENRNLPGYILLHGGAVIPGGMENFSNGFLPATNQAMPIRPEGNPVENLVPGDQDPMVQRSKLDIAMQQDREYLASIGQDDAIESAIANFEMAYQMQSLVPDVLNLERESESTRRLYGLDSPDKNKRFFGLQCLRARRLIESGVRFVEVTAPEVHGGNNGAWDQHTHLKEHHEENAFFTDQAITALIKDLKARGLWEETLIVWATEFGRTPHTGNGNGRDHHETAFTVWLAGAGVKGGTLYGTTDELGMKAVENIVAVHDLHATILHLLGLDHQKLTYRFGGRDVSLTDVHGHVIRDILS